jgi:hypothetical protein
MQTLYLHVGLHKTATTALQLFFAQNKEELQKRGICYPQTGLSAYGGHHPLVSALGKPNPRFFPAEKSLEAYLEELQSEAQACPAVLISSEHLSDGAEISKVKKLTSLASQTKIILYLRRQDTYIESFYLQMIKDNLTVPFEELSLGMIPNLSYRKICDYWAAHFGRENLMIRVYEKGQFAGGNIFQDFLNLLEVPLDHSFALQKKRINIAFGRDEAEFKRIANRLKIAHHVISPLEQHTLINELKVNQSRYYSVEERKSILAQFEAENAYIASHYLGRQDGKLFCEPIKEEPQIPYPGLSQAKIIEITRFIYENKAKAFESLCEAIQRGITSTDPLEQAAAQQLQIGLLHVFLSLKLSPNPHNQIVNQQLKQENERLQQANIHLKNEIKATRKSLSFKLGWMLTAPLRWAWDVIHK